MGDRSSSTLKPDVRHPAVARRLPSTSVGKGRAWGTPTSVFEVAHHGTGDQARQERVSSRIEIGHAVTTAAPDVIDIGVCLSQCEPLALPVAAGRDKLEVTARDGIDTEFDLLLAALPIGAATPGWYSRDQPTSEGGLPPRRGLRHRVLKGRLRAIAQDDDIYRPGLGPASAATQGRRCGPCARGTATFSCRADPGKR